MRMKRYSDDNKVRFPMEEGIVPLNKLLSNDLFDVNYSLFIII